MKRYLWACSLLVLFSLPVLADPVSVIGVPVADSGLTISVGTVAGDGTITMYIPLHGTGIYDDSGFGQSADSVQGPVNNTGGSMDMWLYFSPNAAPNTSAIMTLIYSDLDLLDGGNDPDNNDISGLVKFLEAVDIFDSGGSSVASITSLSDAGVSGNFDTQTIILDLTALSVSVEEDFWVRTSYTSTVNYTGNGTLVNTAETVKATLVTTPVPEPATLLLFLFGSGLLAGAAGLRNRFKG
jgi:hypothetical protein